MTPWQVWIDTGGTFTDAVARPPGEEGLRRVKVLSSSALRGAVTAAPAPDRLTVRPAWEVRSDFFAGCTAHRLGGDDGGDGVEVAAYRPADGTFTLAAELAARPGDHLEVRSPDEAPVLAARLLTATPHGRPLPPMALRLATTRGTNALLERRGAAVALFVTRGLGDLLEIGTQQRPELFDLEVRKPRPLYRRVVEVAERLDAGGGVLTPPDLEAVETAAREALEAGCETAAVALLHSYVNPAHEVAVGERLRACGFRWVAESAELAPLIKLLPRAETAVVEAYLAPVLAAYLDGVAAALPEAGETAGGGASTLHVMTSAGGLVRRPDFRAKDSLLSGPAGGVAGAARAGRRAGFHRLLSFDMGGTSTDVARWDGDFEYRFEQRVGDAHLVAPALAIETVAAGGGSICAFTGGRLRVGPESAGARPGPACYGGGGPLTLTDVNLLLGLLDPDRFGIPVDPAAAEAAGDALAAAVAATGAEQERDELLVGCRAIADERMADAIRSISVRRGYDPAGYALVAFGGAGGQHACAVAARLGVATVLVPPDAGLLSALGLGGAVVERFSQRQVLRPLAELAGGGLAALLGELEEEARAAVTAEGVAAEDAEVRRRIVHLRFAGQESTLAVEAEPGEGAAALRQAFAAAYRERYGYLPEERELEVESARVVASSRRGDDDTAAEAVPPHAPEPVDRRRCRLGGSWRRVPVHERGGLAAGARFDGPALVFERHGATVVEPGWRAAVDGAGTLVLHRGAS